MARAKTCCTLTQALYEFRGKLIMLKQFLFVAVLILSDNALANDKWAYKVIFLPGPAAGAKLVKQSNGSYLDSTKTDILNKLGSQGWQLVSVTGTSGEDHAAYLRKQQ